MEKISERGVAEKKIEESTSQVRSRYAGYIFLITILWGVSTSMFLTYGSGSFLDVTRSIFLFVIEILEGEPADLSTIESSNEFSKYVSSTIFWLSCGVLVCTVVLSTFVVANAIWDIIGGESILSESEEDNTAPKQYQGHAILNTRVLFLIVTLLLLIRYLLSQIFQSEIFDYCFWPLICVWVVSLLWGVYDEGIFFIGAHTVNLTISFVISSSMTLVVLGSMRDAKKAALVEDFRYCSVIGKINSNKFKNVVDTGGTDCSTFLEGGEEFQVDLNFEDVIESSVLLLQ